VSEVELEGRGLCGDAEGDERMVPVVEAIRYRRRAQSAEKTAADLTEEVVRLKEANASLTAEVEGLRTDGALAAALGAAGVVDLEAAMLIARSRMAKEDGCDAAAVVEALRKEKGYLFGAGSSGAATAAMKTAGVKERTGGQAAMEDAASRAAASGSRLDVHEYMRRRRRFV